MPHITLLYPFRPRSEFDVLVEAFAQVCSCLSPFEVEMADLRWFQHRSSYTVWLAPEPQDAFVNLQAALWRIVPDCDDVCQHRGGFTPHLSVGQVRGRGALRRLLAELQSAWTPIRFCASEIRLIWRNDPPDDVFRFGPCVKLGGEAG
jgi:2'-5' RNA ligase